MTDCSKWSPIVSAYLYLQKEVSLQKAVLAYNIMPARQVLVEFVLNFSPYLEHAHKFLVTQINIDYYKFTPTLSQTRLGSVLQIDLWDFLRDANSRDVCQDCKKCHQLQCVITNCCFFYFFTTFDNFRSSLVILCIYRYVFKKTVKNFISINIDAYEILELNKN